MGTAGNDEGAFGTGKARQGPRGTRSRMAQRRAEARDATSVTEWQVPT
jgi:hypothetical protein